MKPYGKAQRLVSAIAEVAGEGACARILDGLVEPHLGASNKRKAEWARDVTTRMDELLTPEQRSETMHRRACEPLPGDIARIRTLWLAEGDLDAFAGSARELGLHGCESQGNTLRMSVATGRCHCLPVYGTKVPLSDTYCQCCSGHVRKWLEPVFGVDVVVERESSIIAGGDACWFVAHIGGVGAAPPKPAPATDAEAALVCAAPHPLSPPDGPLPAKVVEFPASLSVPDAEAAGLRVLHALLVAIATAAHARTRAEQDAMRRAIPRMLDVLWNMGLTGQLIEEPEPHLWMRKADAKRRNLYMPDSGGARELMGFRMPGARAEGVELKRTFPKDWEIRLGFEGPENGLATIRALQRYVRALCDTHGEPEFRGSRRYVGQAYVSFRRADMSVLAR